MTTHRHVRFFLITLVCLVAVLIAGGAARFASAASYPQCINGYCISASPSHSGSYPAYTGQVNVTHGIPASTGAGFYVLQIEGEWWSTGDTQWRTSAWSGWFYSQASPTTAAQSFSFPNVNAGDNWYQAYGNPYWCDWSWNCTFLGYTYFPTAYYPIPLPPPPTADLKANGLDAPITNPLTVTVPATVTLSWTSTNSTDCSSSGSAGNYGWGLATSGSMPFAVGTPGDYSQKIACQNAAGQLASDTVYVTAVNPPPPPVPAAPAVSPEPSFAGQTLTFSWGVSSGATYYVLEADSGPCVSGNCFPGDPPGDPKTMTSSGYAVGSHWVKVKACNASGCSAYSGQTAFTVQGPPPAPTVSPDIDPGTAGVQQRHGDTSTVSWAPVTGATSYVFYAVPTGGATSTCAAGCPLTGTQVGPGGNQLAVSAGKFLVALTACNASGCSAPSPSVDLTVQSNDAAFVSEVVKNRTIPPDQPAVSVSAARPFHAEVTLRNTGTAAWDSAGEYVLRSKNPDGNATWGVSEITLAATSPLVSSVPPNATVTFAGDLAAPGAGIYNFQWQMYRKTNAYGYFGASSTNVTVTVGGQPAEKPIQVKVQIRARQHLTP